VYEVTLDAPISSAVARQLEQGVVVQGRRTLPARLHLAQSGASLRVTVTLYEGRNRQVRRMFESVGCTVVWLQRVRIGAVILDGLGAGEARPLTDDEVRALRQATR
jgi:pseudouridine synthase